MSIFKEEDLQTMPELYAQDGKGDSAIVHLVVRIKNTQDFAWLLTEYSKEEGLFFGFCCLGDFGGAELGYVSKEELSDLSNKYAMSIEKCDLSLKDAKKKYLDI